MNMYTICRKAIAAADKAKEKTNRTYENILTEEERKYYADNAYSNVLKREYNLHDRALDLMLEYMEDYKDRINAPTGDRWYMLTIRPPPHINWIHFKGDWERFVSKWETKWLEYAYCYEQKGENIDELGKGFHVHMRILTNTKNYYPSHMKRDAKAIFTYVHDACIKAEIVKNINRCIEYMNGDKKDNEKAKAVLMDTEWRNAISVPALVKKYRAEETMKIEVISN